MYTRKQESELSEESELSSSIGDKEEAKLRSWCTGHPPKPSFMNRSRRSTLADIPELDHKLSSMLIRYNSANYLPFTLSILHTLSDYTKGAKPIANISVFNNILLAQDINAMQPGTALAVLSSIGEHCENLLITASVRSSDSGVVFDREFGDVYQGSDWDDILNCFPNLETVVVEHSEGQTGLLSVERLRSFLGERYKALKVVRLDADNEEEQLLMDEV